MKEIEVTVELDGCMLFPDMPMHWATVNCTIGGEKQPEAVLDVQKTNGKYKLACLSEFSYGDAPAKSDSELDFYEKHSHKDYYESLLDMIQKELPN